MIKYYGNSMNHKIRVFISSTFADMQEERNVLVNGVFPKLRRKFSRYMVDITEVDLRWGISEVDAESSRILEVCIGEVLRCKPFFIGIIGNRYGSLAAKEDIENLPPAYRNAIGADIPNKVSLTELEIRAGVFCPNNSKYAHFFKKEGSDSEKECDELKELITHIESEYKMTVYANLLEFEENAYKQLENFVLTLLPGKKEIPYEDIFYFSHLCVLEDNATRYCADNLVIAGIERTLNRHRKVYLYGAKGTGKSACISWLIKREGVDRNGNVFFHYATAGSQSLNSENLFFRVRLFLADFTGYQSMENDDHDAVIDILKKVVLSERIVMFFDAVEQYNDVTLIYKLFALAEINSKIHVVCTGAKHFNRISQEEIIAIEQLSSEQVRQIIIGTLNKHGKRIDRTLISKVVDRPNFRNPLYLHAFITQLRMYGVYQNFETCFNEMVVASDFGELFSIMINRLKTYFISRNLDEEQIYKALALILYTNRGVTEIEIQNMVGFTAVSRSVLLSTIELFVVEDNGLIRFNHDLVISEIESLLTERQKDYRKWVMNAIIEYCNKNDYLWRAYSELPYQLFVNNCFDELKNVIVGVNYFSYLLEKESYNLIAYLTVLTEHQETIYDNIKQLISKKNIFELMKVFLDSGCYYTVIKLFMEYGTAEKEKVIEMMDMDAWAKYELASNCYEDAIIAYKELLQTHKEKYPEDEVGYATRSFLLGGAYKSAGKIIEAYNTYQENIDVLMTSDVTTGKVVWALDVYGGYCYGRGMLYDSVDVFEKAIEMSKYLYGDMSSELAWAYCYAWATYYYLGEVSRSIEIAKEAYKIYDSVYMGHGVKIAWAAENLGIALLIEKEYQEAEELFLFAIRENDGRIPAEMRPHVFSITAYCDLATLYYAQKDYDKAKETILFTSEEAQKKYSKNHMYAANIFLNEGIINKDIKRIEKAIEIYCINGAMTPDIFFAKVCLARVQYLLGNNELAKATILACASDYFIDTRDTDLITYLICETLEKIVGEMRPEVDYLYRFADYYYYLTHNNASNIILIPLI